MSEAIERFGREKLEAEQSFKKEIKVWKKDLGAGRRFKIKLEKKKTFPKPNLKLSSSSLVSSPMLAANDSPDSPDTSCTICSLPLKDYILQYFLGHEINPTCNSCYLKSSDKNRDSERNDITTLDPSSTTCPTPVQGS